MQLSKFSSISLSAVSEVMGVSQWCIRIGLQNGVFPFGEAIQVNNGMYSYYIDPYKFAEYIGIANDILYTLCDTLS